MNLPMVIVVERGHRLVERLRRHLNAPTWVLRHVVDVAECDLLVGSGHPSVLVLSVAADAVAALQLLSRLQAEGAHARVVVVIEEDQPEVGDLSWDLGAAAVLTRARIERLPAIVGALAQALTAERG